MNIIIEEIQTNAAGVCTPLPPLVYTSEAEAEAAYHNKLAYAALSDCAKHAVSMLSDQGVLIKRECYRHSEPVVIPEPTVSAE